MISSVMEWSLFWERVLCLDVSVWSSSLEMTFGCASFRLDICFFGGGTGGDLSYFGAYCSFTLYDGGICSWGSHCILGGNCV